VRTINRVGLAGVASELKAAKTKTPPGAETGLDAKHNIYVPSEGMGELFS
jgi:hypothetical protein